MAIPAQVSFVGSEAFARCDNLQAIEVDETNAYYSSVDGVLFNRDGSVLVQFPAGRGGSYSIPTGVRAIGDGAFAGCANLVKLKSLPARHPLGGAFSRGVADWHPYGSLRA